MSLTTVWYEGPAILPWVVVLSASLLAAATDLATRQIPNALTLPVLALGYSTATWAGGLAGVMDALAATALLGVPFVLLFTLGGGGAGDAKIMAALGPWLGLANGAIVLLAVSLAGAILSLIVLTVRLWRERASHPDRPQETDLVALRRQTIPYGVAIWAGVWGAAGGMLLWGS